MRTLPLVLAALVGASLPSAASAQESPAFAQQRFTRGTALYDAHDYAHALEEFRASIALFGSPNTRLYLGRCLRELGRFDEAVPEFERAVREAADRALQDPRYRQTRDAAQAELSQAEARVGRLTLTIPDIPASASVRVNGREVPVAALGIAIPVMPGALAIVVEAPGFEREERSAEVAVGREATVSVALRRLPEPAVVAPTVVDTTPPPTAPPPRRGPPRALGWIGVGVGAVGFAGFAGFYVLASGRFDDFGQRCPVTPCSAVSLGEVDEGRTYQILTNVSLGVGIAGAAAAITLFAIGRSSNPPPVSVAIGPRSLGVGGTF